MVCFSEFDMHCFFVVNQVESTTGAVTTGLGEELPAAFARAGASVRAIVPFPVTARRTNRAHPALGRGLMPSPTEDRACAPTAVSAPVPRRGAHQGNVRYPDPAVV